MIPDFSKARLTDLYKADDKNKLGVPVYDNKLAQIKLAEKLAAKVPIIKELFMKNFTDTTGNEADSILFALETTCYLNFLPCLKETENKQNNKWLKELEKNNDIASSELKIRIIERQDLIISDLEAVVSEIKNDAGMKDVLSQGNKAILLKIEKIRDSVRMKRLDEEFEAMRW